MPLLSAHEKSKDALDFTISPATGRPWNLKGAKINRKKSMIHDGRLVKSHSPVLKTSQVALILEQKTSAANTTPPHVANVTSTLTRTPSLTSSASSASSDSKSGSCSPTCIHKPQEVIPPRSDPSSPTVCKTKSRDVILFRSTSAKHSFLSQRLKFCGASAAKLNNATPEGGHESRTRILPMITLTTPEDENEYCTVSPFILELFCPYTIDTAVHKNHLRVPTLSPTSITETARKRRQYPHPAGPWLRPTHPRDLRIRVTSKASSTSFPSTGSSTRGQRDWQWKDGCRNAEGTVIGWENKVTQINKKYNNARKNLRKPPDGRSGGLQTRKIIHPAIISFPPPRLPTEKEIQQRQLQFNIEKSLRLGRQVYRKRSTQLMASVSDASQPMGIAK